jgi:glycerophosphoryl diester phosphodiesterase
LEYNKDAYELFEIDFTWTSDGQLVCLHDWGSNFKNIFGKQTLSPLSLGEFKKLAASHADFENCTVDSLVNWLRQNSTKRIVTDVKSRNIEALRLISNTFPEHVQRFIPQIYQPAEYAVVTEMGYRDVIWTLYRYAEPDGHVVDDLRVMDLYAVTMPRTRAIGGLAIELDKIGVKSYVHTINKAGEAKKFFKLGIDEIYTDWLVGDTDRREPVAVSP